MEDNSTRVLKRPTELDDGTRILKAPAAAPKRQIPLALRIVWALLRLGVVGLAVLVMAESIGGLIANLGVQWYSALFLGLVLPFLLLIWLRSVIRKRAPKARVKIGYPTLAFVLNLLALIALVVAQPGITSQAAAVQGVNLSHGLARMTRPDHIAPRVMHWTAGKLSAGFEWLETRVAGPAHVAARVAIAHQALAASDPSAVLAMGTTGALPGGLPGGSSAGANGGLPGQVGLGGAVSGTGTSSPGVGPGAAAGVMPGADGVVPADGALPGGAGNVANGGVAGSGAPNGVGQPGSAAYVTTPGPFPGAGPGGAGSSASVPGQSVPGQSVPGQAPVQSVAGLTAPALNAPDVIINLPYHTEPGSTGMLVDVVLQRRFPVRLLVDTGSSVTTLDSATLAQIGATPAVNAPTLTVNTARGPRTDALAIADTLAVGGVEMTGVTVLRCDDCTGPDHQGLLGMNVLNSFTLTIEQSLQLLRIQDRHVRTDQRGDIRPFVTLEAAPEPANAIAQPFVVSAVSKSPKPISSLYARLTLLSAERQVVGAKDVSISMVNPGQRVTVRTEVPLQPKFTYYQVELGEAHW